MTNYEFWWDNSSWGKEDLPIGQISRNEWERPQIGMQLTIKGKLVKITRVSPTSNPTGQKVIYYVEPVNSNWPYKNKYIY